MVTHYPSSNSSSTSLSSPTATTFRPAHASSQAGSSTFSRSRGERAPSSTRSWRDQDQRGHHRSSSIASSSSQTTLVGSYAPPPRSVAGYPTAPPSAYGYKPSTAHQRAPSVASTSAARHSSWHRHRSSSRSRAEREQLTTPAVVQNDFPWFGQTGDVEIEINDSHGNFSKRYLLHQLILAQNSSWFEADLGKESPNTDSPVQHGLPGANTLALINNGNERRRYELDWPSSRNRENRVPLLVQIQNVPTLARAPTRSARNKPPPPSNAFFRTLASTVSNHGPQQQSSEDEDTLQAYDNLFLIFYNHSPRLSTSNIANAYVESKILLSLASSYSALMVVGPRIDHHLLRFGGRLWKQVAKYPPSYLRLGYLARSRAIFSEALVHVVGQWPLGQPQLQRGMVDDAVIDLIEDKIDELEELKLRVETRLLRISLSTSRGDRVSPWNSYFDWLALSLFRQWIADQTAPAPSSRAGPDSQDKQRPHTSAKLVRVYRVISQGGQAYLPQEELKRFLKLKPGPDAYNRDTLRLLNRRIDDLKHLAKEVVRPLTTSFLELDQVGADSSGSGAPSTLTYLTCAKCDERDFAYVWKE